MQNGLSSSPYMQYQPYQPYNANYYPGKSPQYNTSYYQAPQISTVDWKFINECNADMIRATEDVDKMNQILSIFSRSDFQSDSQTNQNPNILKLLSLAQVVINYLMKCQDELKEINHELQQRNTSYENAAKKNNKSSNYYKSKLNKAIVILKKSKTRERCPRCRKTLQSSQELDQHMRTNHNDLWKEWVAVRNGNPLSVTSKNETKLQKQVNKLQKQVEDLTAKQRSQYYNDSNNVSRKNKRFEPSLFDANNVKFFNLSSEDGQIPKQQPLPQPVPQPQVQPTVIQTPTKADDQDNLAKQNAKKRAEDFLSHRRPATPMHPQQVDEIVHKISSMLHEQSKQVSYGEAVKEEKPEELRQDISDDVKSDHPMPETSTINNLKDLKDPVKTPKRKRTKKPQKKEDENESETEEPKEEPVKKPTSEKPDEHCYGDSMPLSSSSLGNSFVFSSEIAQYDSTAVPSSAPKPRRHEESSAADSQGEMPPKKEVTIQDSDGAENESENSFHSESGHSKFELPSNDNDFATYEEFISGEESDHRSHGHPHDKPAKGEDHPEEEDVYYYEDEDEEAAPKPKVKPDGYAPPPPAPAPAPSTALPEGEFEYSYTYEEDVPETKGFFHPSPQPSNKSLRKPLNDDDDELSY